MNNRWWGFVWWTFVVLPGLAAVLVSGYYTLLDWAALRRAFTHWEQLVHNGADTRALMVAQSYHETFRINCFAEGVGVLLGAILFAIGMLGLRPNRDDGHENETHS